MTLVPDPNCGGRGWIPVYSGAKNANGSPIMSGTRIDPRCAGTGMVEKPNVFPTTYLSAIEGGYDPEGPPYPVELKP